MMEVTKHNFEAILPQLRNSIANASFISVDGEFTGTLRQAGSQGPDLFDSASERYSKLRDVVTKYIPCQFGIVCFKEEPNSNSYIADVYNVYLYPRKFGSMSTNFACSCSAVSFLASVGFDFNKFICDGVPFLSSEQGNIIREEIRNGLCTEINRNEKIKDATEIVEQFVLSAKCGQSVEIETPTTDLECSMLQYELKRRFDLFSIEVMENRKICVEKTNGNSNRNLEDAGDLLENLINNICGASQILKLVSEAKIPVVGHNLILDLLFLFNAMHANLPKDYLVWKEKCHNLLPIVFDTKHIVHELNEYLVDKGLESYSLEGVYEFTQNDKNGVLGLGQPKVKLSDSSKKYENDPKKFHEAGFDAFVTGIVFIRLAYFNCVKNRRSSDLTYVPFRDLLTCLKPMSNKVYLARSSLPFLNLIGPEPEPLPADWLQIVPRHYWQRLDKANLEKELVVVDADLRWQSANKLIVAPRKRWSSQKLLEKYRSHKLYRLSAFDNSKPTAFRFGSLTLLTVGVASIVCCWYILRKK